MTPTKTGNVLNWASDIDPNALEQAERTADLPFVEGHLALMPDAHWGMGATIGSVIPTRGAIIPAAVGVDIGCGMIAATDPQLQGTVTHLLDMNVTTCDKVAVLLCALTFTGRGTSASGGDRWLSRASSAVLSAKGPAARPAPELEPTRDSAPPTDRHTRTPHTVGQGTRYEASPAGYADSHPTPSTTSPR